MTVSPKIFLDQPAIGLFAVTRVDQTTRSESHVAGIFSVSYRVTLEVKESIPTLDRRTLVMQGAKGEGIEAGALGLQDWLPTMPGDEYVLAFDPALVEQAETVVYVGGGPQAASVWQAVKRFYAAVQPGGKLDPAVVANDLAAGTLLPSVYFQLLFHFDRAVYRNAAVTGALGIYFRNSAIPAMDRRNAVAHYTAQPSLQAEALSEFAVGLLQLAYELQQQGQAPSAGVVLERLYGFCFDTQSQIARIPRPHLPAAEESGIRQLLDACNRQIVDAIMNWLFN